MTAPVTTQWTVDALQALPDGGLEFEVVDGKRHRLAFHTSSHENAIALLFHLVSNYVARTGAGEVRRAPTALVIDARTLLRPDLVVLPSTADAPDAVPLLVVEVLSPSTAALDRGPKRTHYQRLGVGELWLLDIDEEVCERWRPAADAPELVRERVQWQIGTTATPLDLYLPAFFSEVHLDD